MSDLIVLGIIPGTNIQFGFIWWLVLCGLCWFLVRSIRRIRRAQTIRFALIQISLMLATYRRQRA